MSDLTELSLDDDDLGMGILQHLNELRIRFTWAAGFLLLFTVISLTFTTPLFTILTSPYCGDIIQANEGRECLLQTLSPTEGLSVYFKISLAAGGVLSMPFLLYQFWLFITPALTKKERKQAYLFVPAAFGLFLLGISFAWFVALPAAINFLQTFLDNFFENTWQAQEYIDFVTRMLFWLGVSFEMPLIVYFLSRAGFVSSKALLENWRYAIVGIAVLAAVITPSPDPITMLITMAPLLVLYFVSAGLAKIGYRQFSQRMDVELEETEDG